jgi:hypothetical protein
MIFAKKSGFRHADVPSRDLKKKKLKIGKIYWTDGQGNLISLDDSKDSKFLLVNDQYPKNEELYKKKLDLTNKESPEELALLRMEFLLS